jgi:hypothetical protein
VSEAPALDYPVRLYMDESGNGNEGLPLIVGAITTDVDAENIETEVRQLYETLSARRPLKGLPSFEEFRRNGFHAKNDPIEVASPFLELLQQVAGFKAYIYITDRSGLPALSEDRQIEHLYAMLVADNLIKYRAHSDVFCFMEENSSIRNLVRTLPNIAAERATARLGHHVHLPTLHVEMVKKQDAMSLAIIDYIMSAVSRWARKNYDRDVAAREYRGFLEIEPTISLLYSVERGVLLNRKII